LRNAKKAIEEFEKEYRWNIKDISVRATGVEYSRRFLRELDENPGGYKKAKLQAGLKPTALCSAINKENSIKFPLDFLHYLYNYYMVCVLFFHVYHMTHHMTSCDVML